MVIEATVAAGPTALLDGPQVCDTASDQWAVNSGRRNKTPLCGAARRRFASVYDLGSGGEKLAAIGLASADHLFDGLNQAARAERHHEDGPPRSHEAHAGKQAERPGDGSRPSR